MISVAERSVRKTAQHSRSKRADSKGWEYSTVYKRLRVQHRVLRHVQACVGAADCHSYLNSHCWQTVANIRKATQHSKITFICRFWNREQHIFTENTEYLASKVLLLEIHHMSLSKYSKRKNTQPYTVHVLHVGHHVPL